MPDLTAQNAKQKPKLTANMWMYALGIMGINLAIGLINSFQAEFFNNILAADLMIFAAILLASKFISIIADFVIGNLIDRANFKAGKMRPWILISAFPLAVISMIMFVYIPFGSDAGKYVYITFMTILWNISMTLADIPSQGMLSFLSHDADTRNSAAGVANTLKTLALAIPGVIVTIIAMITNTMEDGDKLKYLITAGVMCGLGLIFQLLMYFKCKEQFKSQTSSAMSFKEMFRELRDNKQMLILFLTFMLGFGRNIGLGIAVQASYVLVRDGLDMSTFLGGILGNEVLYGSDISWLIGITSALSSAIVIILNPMINRKLGEKKYFIVAGFYGFVISLISVLMYCLSPSGSPLRSLWAIWIYQFIFSISYAPNGYLPVVMTSDIVDYQEWKTGKRTEGTQFAILSMSNKLSNALSVSIGIFLMGAIGFNANTANGIYQSGGDISTYITDSMQNKTWIIYFLIPGLCMLASSIVMFFYKIDEKTKKQMRAELAERRAAEAVANGEGEEVACEVANDAQIANDEVVDILATESAPEIFEDVADDKSVDEPTENKDNE